LRPKVVTPVVAVAAIVIEAVTEVADVNVIVPLTPGLADTTAVAPERFVPVKVNGAIVVPTVPDDVDNPVSAVVAALTVKGKLKFVPPIASPSVVAPVVAVPAIVTKAVTLVLEGAPVIEPLTPGLPDTTAVAPARFVPVKVTLNEVPALPEDGVIDVSVGVAELTVKFTE
jgi:hypothetical protein